MIVPFASDNACLTLDLRLCLCFFIVNWGLYEKD